MIPNTRQFNHNVPYTAKTVVFYKEGDNYFSGIRVPISKYRYRNMDSLLDELNSNIPLPFGVRRLTTPHGKNTITSLDELEHGGKYVAGSSTKRCRGVDLDAVVKFRRLQEDTLKAKLDNKFSLGNTIPLSQAYDAYKKKIEKGRNGVVSLPLTAKQLFFVRNGKPSKIYRALLNPLRPLNFELLLEEVSKGLQVAIFKVYSYQGKRLTSIEDLLELNEARVLAVPRNEKPIFRGKIYDKISTYDNQLPKINNEKKENTLNKNKKDNDKTSDSSSYRVHSSSSANGFTNLASKKLTKQQIFPQIFENRKQSITISQRKGTPHPKDDKDGKNEDSDSGRPHSTSENEGSLNGTYGRKHSMDYPFSNVKEETFEEEDDEYQEEEDEEEYSEKEEKDINESKIESDNESHISDDRDKEVDSNIVTDDEDKFDLVGNIAESLHHEPESNEMIKVEDSDERNNAATVIQKHVRGYLVRKELKNVSFVENSEVINEENNNANNNSNNETKNNNAAIVIQNNWREYLKKKKLQNAVGNFKFKDQTSSTESLESNNEEVTIHDDGTVGETIKNTSQSYNYMVTVFIGNRWAADTEADICIIIYGRLKNSGQQYLKQESNSYKFKQNTMENFLLILNEYLGDIEKIEISHDSEGYGSGVFIDRIIISETTCERPRQYLFLINKWFDSGQVDGKTSRIIKPATLFYLDNLMESKIVKSFNRWELVVYGGTDKGEGGTTSNLEVTGYGTSGKNSCKNLYDSRLDNPPNKALLQVDLGDIGQLLKIRIDIDGTGIKPDFYIRKIEMKDLDTGEELVLFCNKWLKFRSLEHNEQSFREFPIYRPGFEPLQIYRYEGKIILNEETKFLNESTVEIQLFGTLGETGRILTCFENFNDNKKNKYDCTFKMDAVCVGNIEGVRIYFHPSNISIDMLEGINILQNIFDCHGCQTNVLPNWMIDKIYIRESLHNPFRYVIKKGRIFILPLSNEDEDVIYCKEMLVSNMEGLATKTSKNKKKNNKLSKWLLTMTIDNTSNLLPKIIICGEKKCVILNPVNLTPIDNKVSFNSGECDLGLLTKIRIEIDTTTKMERFISHEEVKENKSHLYIERIRMTDIINGDELRFNDINETLYLDSIKEFAAIWPDIPPMATTIYKVTITTNNILGHLKIYLDVHGTFGNSGYRLMKDDSDEWFGNEVKQTFQFESISLGPLVRLNIKVESLDDKYEWNSKEIEILDTTTDSIFHFHVNRYVFYFF
uniref:Doublecortin domain-containing protein n=1 Tax=Strongyloides papillosus TaxID=174720 RepID=A0A0N5B7Y5_STREA